MTDRHIQQIFNANKGMIVNLRVHIHIIWGIQYKYYPCVTLLISILYVFGLWFFSYWWYSEYDDELWKLYSPIKRIQRREAVRIWNNLKKGQSRLR